MNELSIAEIADKIMTGKRALILCHVNPDGDAIGSMFALKTLIEAAGGEAVCKCSNEAAPRLRFLYDGQDTVSEGFPSYDYCCSVDVAAKNQLGQLEYMAEMCDFMIDHHASGKPYAPIYCDPNASACGEIIWRIATLLESRGVGIPVKTAALVYAAITSDSGSFKYSSVTPETHIIAAELVKRLSESDFYPDASEIARRLHDCRTFGELSVMRLAIDNTNFYADDALAVLVITREMIEDEDISDDDLGNTVEIPRSIEGVLAAVSAKQSPDDKFVWRLSCRSNCGFDVAAICEGLSGGGHTRAAGGRIYAKTAREAEEAIVAAFEGKLLEWRFENEENADRK